MSNYLEELLKFSMRSGVPITSLSSFEERLKRMIKKLLSVVLFLVLGCNQNSSSLVESTGTLEATQIDIRAEVGGKVLKLYFDDGDRVKPGAVFGEIDKEKLEYASNARDGYFGQLCESFVRINAQLGVALLCKFVGLFCFFVHVCDLLLAEV